MYIFIRHGKKRSDGKLSLEGKCEAFKLRKYFKQLGLSEAFVAPNTRAEQTAKYAGLRIVGHLPELASGKYEEHLNTEVVGRMLAQEGKPWEKSFTRAVLEDPMADEFYKLGEAAVLAMRQAGLMEVSWREYREYEQTAMILGPERVQDPRVLPLVFIGSSPIVELAYLSLQDSRDWRLFPRCRELEGFRFWPFQKGANLIARAQYGLE